MILMSRMIDDEDRMSLDEKIVERQEEYKNL